MSVFSVGVDSGTQSTKVVIVDADSGSVVARGQAPHVMIAGLSGGASEQDPAVWIEAFRIALREALRKSAFPPERIVALGVSGQQHGFVPVDRQGRVIRPAKLWNDTSTISETEAIIQALGGPRAFLDKAGLGLAVGFTASKILWLKKNEPDHFRRLATVLLPHNYLNFFLTGIAHMEYGDASGTGLMDVRARTWRAEAVAAVDADLASKLPALSHPSDPVGFLKDGIAGEFGLGRVLVSSGGGDNMMGAIGTGNVSPGLCTVSLGTSGTIYSYFREPFFDSEGEIAAFCDSTGGWLPLLCTMNVTNTTELWKAVLGIDNDGRDERAAQSPPGADGLVFLPFVDGERVPVLPEATAVFFGLNRANFNAPGMTRAVMEGTILNLGYGFERLRALGLRPREIRATGGAAKSAFWLRLVADIFQGPVITLEEPEAAAFGAALQAIWNWRKAKGENIPISELTGALVKTSGPPVEPDPKNGAVYRAVQAKFNSIWRALKPEFSTGRRASA